MTKRVGIIGGIGQDMFMSTQIIFDPAQEGFPTWSPDGKRIAYTSTRSGNFDVWLMDIDMDQIKRELSKHNK